MTLTSDNSQTAIYRSRTREIGPYFVGQGEFAQERHSTSVNGYFVGVLNCVDTKCGGQPINRWASNLVSLPVCRCLVDRSWWLWLDTNGYWRQSCRKRCHPYRQRLIDRSHDSPSTTSKCHTQQCLTQHDQWNITPNTYNVNSPWLNGDQGARRLLKSSSISSRQFGKCGDSHRVSLKVSLTAIFVLNKFPARRGSAPDPLTTPLSTPKTTIPESAFSAFSSNANDKTPSFHNWRPH